MSLIHTLGFVAQAQPVYGFYIEPLINIKTNTFTKHELPHSQSTNYYLLEPYRSITPVGINLGLNLGYKFKNADKLHLGFSQDESLSGLRFYGNEIQSSGVYTNHLARNYSHYGGVKTLNLNVLFKKKVIHTFLSKVHSTYLDIHLNLGLSYFYKPNNGLENLSGQDGISYYSKDSTKVTLQEGIWVVPQPFRYSLKLNTGIEFTLGRRSKEWFSMGVSYITNFSSANYFSYSTAVVSLEYTNGQISTYVFTVKSRGNGLYYQISKRFYPFQWLEEHKKKKAAKHSMSTSPEATPGTQI